MSSQRTYVEPSEQHRAASRHSNRIVLHSCKLMQGAAMELTGGCLCGGVRFRITAEPLVVYYCHCTMCRKLSGCPFSVGAAFPMESFVLTGDEPRTYESSPVLVRLTCGKCGSLLGSRQKDNPKLISVRVGCLDDPGAVRPNVHVFTSTQVRWCEIADNLPRYAKSGPEVDRVWSPEGWHPID